MFNCRTPCQADMRKPSLENRQGRQVGKNRTGPRQWSWIPRQPPSPDGPGPHCLPWEVIPMAVDAHYRDKNGEISRKHGNALVSRLRTSYGGGFAQGCANDDKLSDILAKLDERSLYKLVRDHKSGMLPIRLRTPWIIAPRP
jgi:hypothetical protein